MNWLQDLKIFIITGLVGVAALLPVYQSDKDNLIDEGSVEQASLSDAVSDEDILEMMSSEIETGILNENLNEADIKYITTLAEYESLEKMYETSEKSSTLVSSDAPLVDYEDVKTCSVKKLAIEKIIKNNKKIADLRFERSPEGESKLLPRHCVTHVMNQLNLGSSSFAQCPNGSDHLPLRGGVKPCVTQNLVNVTYNSLVDIAECLNIDPKNLLPKLAIESGLILNVLGVSNDAGVGQLTGGAISDINKNFSKYFDEMNKATIIKPACLRVMKYKSLLAKVSDDVNKRCSLIVPSENPIKNILYMAIFNRINMDRFSGIKYIAGNDYIDDNGDLILIKNTAADNLLGDFKKFNILEKLEKLGLKDVNPHDFVSLMSLGSYNNGYDGMRTLLNSYLDKRIAINKSLTWKDFDFHNPELANDPYTNEEKTVTAIARSYIKSPLKPKNDTTLEEKKINAKRVKELAQKVRNSHFLTFPEYLTYNHNNNFLSSNMNPENIAKIKSAKNKVAEQAKYSEYRLPGAPGYLNFIAAKDVSLRSIFSTSSYGPDYCSNPNLLMHDKNP